MIRGGIIHIFFILVCILIFVACQFEKKSWIPFVNQKKRKISKNHKKLAHTGFYVFSSDISRFHSIPLDTIGYHWIPLNTTIHNNSN